MTDHTMPWTKTELNECLCYALPNMLLYSPAYCREVARGLSAAWQRPVPWQLVQKVLEAESDDEALKAT
ncbi:MAG: hypothetical protein M1829_003193 [Trizodia sp. TS-e1964]|nr:MAG: hypothetical protein M1829_003193 [Trizodia sp. TS-e1964]